MPHSSPFGRAVSLLLAVKLVSLWSFTLTVFCSWPNDPDLFKFTMYITQKTNNPPHQKDRRGATPKRGYGTPKAWIGAVHHSKSLMEYFLIHHHSKWEYFSINTYPKARFSQCYFTRSSLPKVSQEEYKDRREPTPTDYVGGISPMSSHSHPW